MILEINVERFKLRKLSELEVKKQYRIKLSNRFAAWRTYIIGRTYTGFGKTLKKISKPQLKIV
jgi:hypothetical protein